MMGTCTHTCTVLGSALMHVTKDAAQYFRKSTSKQPITFNMLLHGDLNWYLFWYIDWYLLVITLVPALKLVPVLVFVLVLVHAIILVPLRALVLVPVGVRVRVHVLL